MILASSGVSGIVDLSSATSASINDLRLAFQTQRLLEKDARGGTRYVEVIKSHFGVNSPIPAYKGPSISEVLTFACRCPRLPKPGLPTVLARAILARSAPLLPATRGSLNLSRSTVTSLASWLSVLNILIRKV